MSEARKGLRVRLTLEVWERHQDSMIVRTLGTLTSGRILANHRVGEEEGAFVRVKWDGLTTPEKWHLSELSKAAPEGGAG